MGGLPFCVRAEPPAPCGSEAASTRAGLRAGALAPPRGAALEDVQKVVASVDRFRFPLVTGYRHFVGMENDPLAVWAKETAARLLDVADFRDRRWRHVQAVGAKAEQLAPAFGEDGPLLIAAAWLHDIGYASELQRTGFHHLDGARALTEWDSESRLPGLVANHSAGALEAPMRGLESDLAAYPDELGPVRDALWTCDMTTSPVGEPIDFEDRLKDIVARYGPEHSVPRSISEGADEIRAAIRRTNERAAAAGIAPRL